MKKETREEILGLDTKQKVFDYVVNFLVKQGKPSISTYNNEDCQYYSDDGKRCAVGCLILPEEYDQEWDSDLAAYDIITDKIPRLKPFDDILYELQQLHDEPENWNLKGFSPSGFEVIEQIAANHKLILCN